MFHRTRQGIDQPLYHPSPPSGPAKELAFGKHCPGQSSSHLELNCSLRKACRGSFQRSTHLVRLYLLYAHPHSLQLIQMRQPRQHDLLTRFLNLARQEDLVQNCVHLSK
jgi:hypothetical protein